MFKLLITISKFWRQQMIPTNRSATHPGVILLKEFIEPLGLSQKAVAAHIGIPVQRVNEIVRGKRGVSPNTAWLLSEAFKTSPEFWLNLQATHDLSLHKPKHHVQPLVAGSA
jgi:addiction module HigA family antidote